MAKASAALAVVTALAWALAATQADTCPLIHLRYGKPFTSRKTVGLSLEVAVHKSQASTVNATNLPVLAVKLPDGFRRVRQDAYPDSPKEAYPLTFDTERTFADRRWTVYARNVLTPTVLKRKIKLKMAVTCSRGPIVTFDVSTYLNKTGVITCLTKTPITVNLGKVLATCAPSPAPTQSPTVSPTGDMASIAYKDCGADGTFIKIPTPSTMDSTALQAANLYQYISSLVVLPCVKITLYDGNNFDGSSLDFTGPTSINCLAGPPYNFNDQTRSLKSEFVC